MVAAELNSEGSKDVVVYKVLIPILCVHFFCEHAEQQHHASCICNC